MNTKKNYLAAIQSVQPVNADDYRYTESDYYYLPLMQAEGLNKPIKDTCRDESSPFTEKMYRIYILYSRAFELSKADFLKRFALMVTATVNAKWYPIIPAESSRVNQR